MSVAEQTLVAKYEITDAAIATMAEAYMPLTIAGVEDSAGYERVYKAYMVVKNHDVNVEKTRVQLKADALAYGRAVDGEAKRISALLAPIKNHLKSERDAVDAEKDRIKNAARLQAEAEARAKAEAEEAKRRAEQAAEEARLKALRDAEDARLKAEREKLDAERLEMEAARKAEQDKLNVERAAIEAEKKRLADIEATRLRVIEMDRARKEAAEQARIETEARIAREAAEAKAQAEAAEAARLRAEAMRPDGEKLIDVAVAVEAIVVPEMASELSLTAFAAVRCVLAGASKSIRTIVGEMR
jgi:hypothetical protein